jgi:chromate reductase
LLYRHIFVNDFDMTIPVLALSGSLREKSSNTAVLRAAIQLAPPAMSISLCPEIACLPLFNPDLEGREPDIVVEYKKRLRAAQAFLIASPEYAHGVSGALKNALDWVVGSGEMVGKPVALLNLVPRAFHAVDALTETLTVMGARVIPEASPTLRFTSNRIDTEAALAAPECRHLLVQALQVLHTSVGS